jgi:rubrerythrin
MNSDLRKMLIAQVRQGGYAYVRNLAAAEAAILRGQFNLAKVLRAVAHAQRVLALGAARLLGSESSAIALLQTNLSELEGAPVQEEMEPEVRVKLKQFASIQERTREVILRTMRSLDTHADVMESDVAQSLWGCYNCGYIAEGNRPDACIVCGAVGAEFEWFGPFYAATPEHLGQLTPPEILSTLEAAPNIVAEIISGVDDEMQSRRPSEQEWCVKEIVGHMLETDILFAERVTTLLQGQGVPDLTTPIPPWKLHEGKGYEQMPTDELLERLRQTRRASLAIVHDLKPEQWSRRGTLRGTSTSLLDLGTWLANHDLGHSAQIRRLCGK